MISAPIRSTKNPADVGDREVHPVSRDKSTAAQGSLQGRSGPRALGRLGRGLVYGTGLFLFRPLASLACRLLGWRRSVEIRFEEGVLHFEREISVLGSCLRRESERLPASRLVSVSPLWTRSPEPLGWGALCLALAVIWGLWQVADGIFGRSAALVGLGLGIIAAGAAVDLALYWISGRVPWLTSEGIVIRTTDGRELSAVDLPTDARDRLVAKITEEIK